MSYIPNYFFKISFHIVILFRLSWNLQQSYLSFPSVGIIGIATMPDSQLFIFFSVVLRIPALSSGCPLTQFQRTLNFLPQLPRYLYQAFPDGIFEQIYLFKIILFVKLYARFQMKKYFLLLWKSVFFSNRNISRNEKTTFTCPFKLLSILISYIVCPRNVAI